MKTSETSRLRTVLQLLPDLHSGGVERGTLEMSSALVEHGWNSWVVSNGGRLVEGLEVAGGRHIRWNVGSKSPWALRYIPALVKLCRQKRVDLIHARSRMPAWIAYWAWRCMPRKNRPVFVTTVHGLNSVNAYSRIMTMGENVIAVSDTARDYVLQHYPKLNPEKVTVIHRGVRESEFPRDFRPSAEWMREWYEAFPQTRDAAILTIPGRISRRKGHLEFVEMISGLKKNHPKIKGLIVGGWDAKQQAYVDEVKQRIASQNLQDDILWAGHRSDMKEVYALSALVFSLSNKPESFGRTILEPLCMGVRCVGLDYGGVGEILNNMYPKGKLMLNAPLNEWISTCESLLKNDAPLPKPNGYPLEIMLEREIQCYENWMAQKKEMSSRQD